MIKTRLKSENDNHYNAIKPAASKYLLKLGLKTQAKTFQSEKK